MRETYSQNYPTIEAEGTWLWKCGPRHAWNTQSKYKAWAIKHCSCDFKTFAPDYLKNKETLEILYNLYIIQQPLLYLIITGEMMFQKPGDIIVDTFQNTGFT